MVPAVIRKDRVMIEVEVDLDELIKAAQALYERMGTLVLMVEKFAQDIVAMRVAREQIGGRKLGLVTSRR
jgi:predicted ATP-grasp superfamily ATP-dependent carboligase